MIFKPSALLQGLLILMAVTVVAGCGKDAAEQKPADSSAPASLTLSRKQLAQYGVKLDSLQQRTIRPVLTFNGKVVVLSNSQASVRTQVSGIVSAILVKEGSAIRKGQPLLRLSSLALVELQQSYLSAAAEMQSRKQAYERQRQLYEEKIGSAADFQTAQAAYEAALSQWKAFAEKLRLIGLNPAAYASADKAVIQRELVIVSPMDGYLFKLPATIGMQADPTVELAHILSLSDLHADLFVYEKDINRIREGQAVEILFSDRNIPSVIGKIEFIGRSVETADRMVIVHATFEAPKGYVVLPEMAIVTRASAQGTASVAPALPNDALLPQGDKAQVLCATPMGADSVKIVRLEVAPGASDGKWTAIQFKQLPPAEAQFVVTGTLLVAGAFNQEGE